MCFVIFVLSYLIFHFRDKYLELKNKTINSDLLNKNEPPAIERNPPEKQKRDYENNQAIINSFEWSETGQCLGNKKKGQ